MRKDADGKVTIHNEASTGTETGAVVGAVLGGLLFVIFPVAGIVGGAVAGGLVGRAVAPGLDGNSSRRSGTTCRPVAPPCSCRSGGGNPGLLVGAMRQYQGRVRQTSLPGRGRVRPSTIAEDRRRVPTRPAACSRSAVAAGPRTVRVATHRRFPPCDLLAPALGADAELERGADVERALGIGARRARVPLECIVIDDGSTDGTADLVAGHGGTRPADGPDPAAGQ